MKFLYTFLAGFLALGSLQAQYSEVGVFLGVSSYEGDLNERQLVLPTELHLALGLQYTYVHSDALAFGLMGNIGKITGTDDNFESRKGIIDPNFSFTSPVTDVLGHIRWAPILKRSMDVYDVEGEEISFDWEDYAESSFPVFDKDGMALMVDTAHQIFTKIDQSEKTWIYDRYGHLTVYDNEGEVVMDEYKSRIAPYLVVGLGMSFFSPEVTKLDLASGERSLYTDPEAFSNSHFTVPIGGGLMFDMSEKLYFSLEAAYRYPFTDFIDGVSTERSPDQNDWYLMLGLRANYKFGDVKKNYYEVVNNKM